MLPASNTSRPLFALALTSLLAPAIAAQSFQGIGDLPGGAFSSVAQGVSADGRTVLGSSVTGTGTEAAYWRNGNLVSLGDIAGGTVDAYAAASNYDGSIIVGTGRDGVANRALRWDGPAYGVTQLPQVAGFGGGACALGISPDGKVICGWSSDFQLTAYNYVTGYRIDQGVLTGLQVPVQGNGSDSGVYWSPGASGSVLVGRIRISGITYHGVYWVGSTLHTPPALLGGADYSQIFAASDDGTVLVGTSCSAAAPNNLSGEPCRWQGDVPQSLGVIPGGSAGGSATACNRDGSLVVGAANAAAGSRAFIWDATHGMRELSVVLTNDYGLNLSGWTLQGASAITPDGSVIVGTGVNPSGNTEGWIARLTCTTLAIHCTAKTNALGCVPAISAVGTPSATASSGFVVKSTNMRNNKPGLLLYGVSGAANTPFQGGSLCVAAPVRRSTGINSGGTPSGSDCTGVFNIDFNAFARGLLGGSPIAALSTPGTIVDSQFWGRDPGFPAPNNSQLSNGLRFMICN